MDKFMYCLSVKTGCLLIALIYVLCGSTMFIMGLSPMVFDSEDEFYSPINKKYIDTTLFEWIPFLANKLKRNDAAFYTCVSIAILGGTHLIFNILLILGVCNERIRLICTWLVYHYCSFVFTLVVMISFAIFAFMESYSGTAFVASLVAIPIIVVMMYFHSVVDGLKLQLRDMKSSRRSAIKNSVNNEKIWI